MTLPVEWNEWQGEWRTWFASSGLVRTTKQIAGKNLLADEIIGTFKLYGGQVVELSAVTMPAFGERPERRIRYVGISWLGDNGRSVNGGLVESWSELESALEEGNPME